MRLIIGNPLIAVDCIDRDPRAALFVPIELLIRDENGLTQVTYLKPSSVMPIGQDGGRSADLDAKLRTLLAAAGLH